MQIKKEEMKLSLLKAGEDEFFEKGYDKSSIRSIVSRAHTTIGNFYNYFDSKESLYKELVKDIYTQISDLIQNHGEFESIDQLRALEELENKDFDFPQEDIQELISEFTRTAKTKLKVKKSLWLPKNIKLWKFLLKHIVKKFFPPIDRRFVLLMTGSETTPLSHARQDLQQLLSHHFYDHIKDYSPKYPHKELGSLIAHQLIEGLIEIGRSNYDIQKAEEMTVEQILFIVIGVIGILQGGK